jgi:hypothetical protein
MLISLKVLAASGYLLASLTTGALLDSRHQMADHSVAFQNPQIVNRLGKSDRLKPSVTFHDQTKWDRRNAVPAAGRLPDACEPIISPLTRLPISKIAGRCIS